MLPEKNIKDVLPVHDLIALNIFTHIPIRDLTNNFIEFGKALYQYKDEILKNRLHYYYPQDIIDFLMDYFNEDKKDNAGYARVYRQFITAQKKLKIEMKIVKEKQLSNDELYNFLTKISKGKLTLEICKELQLFPIIFSKRVKESFFNVEKDFNFWHPVNLLLQGIQFEKNITTIFSQFLFEFPVENVIPRTYNPDTAVASANARYRLVDVTRAFLAANFTEKDVDQLAKKNPKLMPLILEGLEYGVVTKVYAHLPNIIPQYKQYIKNSLEKLQQQHLSKISNENDNANVEVSFKSLSI